MRRVLKPRDGDIVINLQDTLGVTGCVQSSMTKQVLELWKRRLGTRVEEFRQADTLESSVHFEIIFITPKNGVSKPILERELRSSAQRILADHYTTSARHP